MRTLANYGSTLGVNITEDHLTNLPLHHIRARFCEFWTKIKYLGNVTRHFHGKISYSADSKSTYIIFKYILSLIWGLNLKENILIHNLSLSIIIHPQKHPKSKRMCWMCRQILPASQHNTEKQRQAMVSAHLHGNPNQARVAVDGVQAPDDLVSTSSVPP